MCTTSKANRAKWVKHVFFVQLLFLQLFCEFEIISKKKFFLMYKYYQSDWDARAQALCAAPMFASPTVPNPNQDEAEQQCRRAE